MTTRDVILGDIVLMVPLALGLAVVATIWWWVFGVKAEPVQPYMSDYAVLGDNPNYSRFLVRDDRQCLLVIQATKDGVPVAMTSQPWHCN